MQTMAKKFRVKVYGKTVWMELTCDHATLDMDGNLVKCSEWATQEIQYRGNDKSSHFCKKHEVK